MIIINQKNYSHEKSCEIHHLTFDSFEEMARVGKNWSFHGRYRLGMRTFGGRYDICLHKNFQMAYAVYYDGMMFSGHTPKGTLTLDVIIDKRGSLTTDRKILEIGDILIMDDDEEHETVFSHAIRKGAVSLSKNFVDRHFPYLHGMSGKVYRDTEGALGKLVASLEKMKDCQNEAMEENLLKSIESLHLDKQQEIVKKLSKKERLLFDVRGYIIEQLENRIKIDNLASRFGMSERTLQIGFKKLFGFTPKKFIKFLKLNLAHREILENKESKTIAEIAMKYGFGNFGLFSKEYRQLFGCLPRETRKFHRRF